MIWAISDLHLTIRAVFQDCVAPATFTNIETSVSNSFAWCERAIVARVWCSSGRMLLNGVKAPWKMSDSRVAHFVQ